MTVKTNIYPGDSRRYCEHNPNGQCKGRPGEMIVAVIDGVARLYFKVKGVDENGWAEVVLKGGPPNE